MISADEHCSISVHNNLHIVEDTVRHSGNDNYWNHGPERKIADWKRAPSNMRDIGQFMPRISMV
jgi:hypothetical protein